MLHFLYPLKTLKNGKVFNVFMGTWKYNIWNKWVEIVAKIALEERYVCNFHLIFWGGYCKMTRE